MAKHFNYADVPSTKISFDFEAIRNTNEQLEFLLRRTARRIRRDNRALTH
jgi:hypothetical protein